MTRSDLPADASPTAPTEAQTPWGARFGWLLGGILGTVAGFVATWLFETKVLRGSVADPSAVATRASSVIVAALFLAGALAGHGFGSGGGPRRARMLASSAGVAVAITLWALLVVSR